NGPPVRPRLPEDTARTTCSRACGSRRTPGKSRPATVPRPRTAEPMNVFRLAHEPPSRPTPPPPSGIADSAASVAHVLGFFCYLCLRVVPHKRPALRSGPLPLRYDEPFAEVGVEFLGELDIEFGGRNNELLAVDGEEAEGLLLSPV